MDELEFKEQLFSFYSKAIQSYLEKNKETPHLIGVDELIDVLFSFGIRHYYLIKEDFLEKLLEMQVEDFHMIEDVQVIDSYMPSEDLRMGMLYYHANNETYQWIGCIGEKQEKRYSDQAEAVCEFSKELKYQMLNIQMVSRNIKEHIKFMNCFMLDAKYETTYLLLHYLNFNTMEDIWDNENKKTITAYLIRKYSEDVLQKLSLPVTYEVRNWLTQYFKYNRHLPLDIFSLTHFYNLLNFTRELYYLDSKEPVFSRFDIHHEAILVNALGEEDLNIDYQGELLQYFMALYPYMSFQEWNIENARDLISNGQKFRVLVRENLKINMEENFSLKSLNNIKMNKKQYIAIMIDLTPELRFAFYDNTKEVFDRLSKDIDFIRQMVPYVDVQFQSILCAQSDNWGLNIYKWFSMKNFEDCQKSCGEHFEEQLKGLLFRMGYIPQEHETVQDLHIILNHFVALNAYMTESYFAKGIFRISGEKMAAALWLKQILMHPQEFSFADLETHKHIIENGRLASIFASSIFKKIIDNKLIFEGEEEAKIDIQTRRV